MFVCLLISLVIKLQLFQIFEQATIKDLRKVLVTDWLLGNVDKTEFLTNTWRRTIQYYKRPYQAERDLSLINSVAYLEVATNQGT